MLRNAPLLFACSLIAVFASTATAATPQITSTTPRGIQRGTTQKVILHGVRVQDGRQLVFDRPGINVKSLKPLDGKQVEMELEVPADTTPGLYPMRLVAETGLSNMIMFGVGTLPMVEEKEPNSEFATPQQIEFNVTVEGTIPREDVDYYAINLKQGQRLTAEVEGTRMLRTNNANFFDPYVAILNAERFELATSDDAPLLQQDCVCSIEAPADGKYMVVVRDSSFGGNNDRYRVHIGSFPRPIAVVPAGGPPGETIDLTFVSISGEEWTEQVTLPSEPSDAYPLIVSNDQGSSPSPNYIRVQPIPNVLEQEPNNSFKVSTPAAVPGAYCGIIGSPGDRDYFSFDAKKDQTLNVKLFARKTLRTALDGVVNIYDAAGKRVGGNDDSGGPDSLFEYKIPADGKYHVGIHDHLRGGGPGFAYRLEVKLAEAGLTMSLPDRARYIATQINVSQGNIAAVMINATRKAVGGPVDVSGIDLPEGVSIVPIQMPANRGTVPLLLTATPQAPLDGRLVNFVGSIAGQDNLKSRFTQQHQLLIGQNNNVVFDFRADRAAVAVIKAAPCKFEIVQPKVPVVRNGAMDLVVKVDRGGLDADILVRMLYNPPGIGSSRSIKIPKGKNEVNLPITANGSAAIGKWPIVVYAAVAGNEIATMPVELEIADRAFNFGFPKTSTELGATADVVVNIEKTRDFAGTCEVELVGLPAGVTCETPKLAVKNDTTQLVFPVKIAENAKVGQHKTLVARARISDPNGLIRQTQGTGVLQIDKPIPAPAATPAPKPAAPAAAATAAPAPVKKKPLSRLEQLRLQKKNGK